MTSLNAVPWSRPMAPRDPAEAHRTATPLELLFDLVFVVAIASAAAELHHGLSANHLSAVVGFVLVFFAIWWAWMSYTWFASAYDCDDVVYRVLTFTIMSGSLLLAAGVPDLFDDGQSGVVVAGYAVMRLGMVALWLRAAAAHPEGRRTALTYAVGITAVQLLWFHPRHVAEWYGLLTIIVLGEVILASVQAVQGALAAPAVNASAGHQPPGASGGISGSLAMLVVGGLLLVFSLWWLYFKREHADLIGQGRRITWVFGYVHIIVFASVAAVGAALAAAVDVVQHSGSASPRTVALALAVPIALYALTLAGLHAAADRDRSVLLAAGLMSAAAVAIALLGLDMGLTVLLIGLVTAAAVGQHIVASHRRVRS